MDRPLVLAAASGLVLGPLASVWAFLESPCGPDSTVDGCVLAAPHATAVLLPLSAGPVLAGLALAVALALRRRARVRRRVLVAGVIVVAAVLVATVAIIAIAPTSYPSPYVPRS